MLSDIAAAVGMGMVVRLDQDVAILVGHPPTRREILARWLTTRSAGDAGGLHPAANRLLGVAGYQRQLAEGLALGVEPGELVEERLVESVFALMHNLIPPKGE